MAKRHRDKVLAALYGVMFGSISMSWVALMLGGVFGMEANPGLPITFAIAAVVGIATYRYF